ncbi:hypothetical protein HDF16_005027 [Granulicella aggregans]|uniref:ABC-type transport system involved in multi-copper enzyme maturation permease subunit n=1 Tax=Granulicella aggregans TaxID=474949 RepID=A0A7W7ZI73_9BACT|nr:hypothetical protein [Granulicella aggregans]MBB5060291.1 hypothetical protein [Granulicella aggregans]
MSQVKTILFKDTRELLPELLVSFIILGIFAVVESSGWGSNPVVLLSASMLAKIFAVLLVMSWGVVVIRLIQTERLVGLNQFWTTRPYEWHKLLCSKALFVFLYVELPLALVQLGLLRLANLPVWNNIHLVLINLAVVSVFFLLPFALIAGLTATFARTVLIMVGVVVFVMATVALGMGAKRFGSVDLAWSQFFVLGLGLLFALASQYRRRDTRVSVLILIAALSIGVMSQAFIPGSSLSVARYHPISHGGPQIRLDNDPQRATESLTDSQVGSSIALHLPLLVSNLAPQAKYRRQAARITLTGADGFTWKSGWISDRGLFSSGSQTEVSSSSADFSIPARAYRRLGSGNVTVSLEFAAQQFLILEEQTYNVSLSGVRVPHLGSCSVDETFSTILCHSAFYESNQFTVVTRRSNTPCTVASEGQRAFGVIGTLSDRIPLPKISPVEIEYLEHTSSLPAPNLCPNTPMTLSEWRAGSRTRFEVDPAPMQLKAYARMERE